MIRRQFHLKHDPAYTVEAIQLHESDTDWAEVAGWCGAEIRMDGSSQTGIYSVLELGHDSAVHSDWVVKQASGWFVWDAAGFFSAFQEVPERLPEAKDETVRMADVEAWMRYRRDECAYLDGKNALDDALDDLREHFQTGTPLDEEVQGPHAGADR